jgi:hypothetical protein
MIVGIQYKVQLVSLLALMLLVEVYSYVPSGGTLKNAMSWHNCWKPSIYINFILMGLRVLNCVHLYYLYNFYEFYYYNNFFVFLLAGIYIYLLGIDVKNKNIFNLSYKKLQFWYTVVYITITRAPFTTGVSLFALYICLSLTETPRIDLDLIRFSETHNIIRLFFDVHYDILFFLIFIAVFVLWMLGTIMVYYNENTALVNSVNNIPAYKTAEIPTNSNKVNILNWIAGLTTRLLVFCICPDGLFVETYCMPPKPDMGYSYWKLFKLHQQVQFESRVKVWNFCKSDLGSSNPRLCLHRRHKFMGHLFDVEYMHYLHKNYPDLYAEVAEEAINRSKYDSIFELLWRKNPTRLSQELGVQAWTQLKTGDLQVPIYNEKVKGGADIVGWQSGKLYQYKTHGAGTEYQTEINLTKAVQKDIRSSRGDTNRLVIGVPSCHREFVENRVWITERTKSNPHLKPTFFSFDEVSIETFDVRKFANLKKGLSSISVKEVVESKNNEINQHYRKHWEFTRISDLSYKDTSSDRKDRT